MIKRCVICGSEFTAPPSSKKITCSRECSSKRKSTTHTGKKNVWTETQKRTRAQIMRNKGLTDALKNALKIANSMPESQRGPQNRNAKIWILIDPDGNEHTIVNLLDWSRKNAHLFEVVRTVQDRERIAINIKSGFGNIVQSMKGQRKHPVSRYKGWSLATWPDRKESEE